MLNITFKYNEIVKLKYNGGRSVPKMPGTLCIFNITIKYNEIETTMESLS